MLVLRRTRPCLPAAAGPPLADACCQGRVRHHHVQGQGLAAEGVGGLRHAQRTRRRDWLHKGVRASTMTLWPATTGAGKARTRRSTPAPQHPQRTRAQHTSCPFPTPRPHPPPYTPKPHHATPRRAAPHRTAPRRAPRTCPIRCRSTVVRSSVTCESGSTTGSAMRHAVIGSRNSSGGAGQPPPSRPAPALRREGGREGDVCARVCLCVLVCVCREC